MAENIKNDWKTILFLTTGLLLSCFGLSVLIGWHTATRLLIQLQPFLAPIPYTTALSFVFCGISLLTLILNLRPISFISAILMLLFVFVNLLEQFSSVNLGMDQWFMPYYAKLGFKNPLSMAPNTSICLILGALSLIIFLLSPKLNRWTSFITGVFSTIIIAISLVAVVGYLSSLETAYGWSFFAKMNLRTAIACLLMGFTFFVYSQYSQPLEKFPFQLASIVGLGALIASFSFWQSVKTAEYTKIQQLSQDNAQFLKNNIHSTIEDASGAFDRMSARWKTAGGTNKQLWEENVYYYLRDLEGLKRISWIDSSGKVKWIIPENNEMTGKPLFESKAIFERIRQLGKGQATRTLNTNGALIIFTPLYAQDEFQGYVVGEIDLKDLIEKISSQEYRGKYNLSISEGNQLLYTTLQNKNIQINDLSGQSKIDLDQLHWKLKIYPKEGFVKKQLSILPTFVLILGFLLSAASSLAAYFGQLTNQKRKIAEVALEKLQASLADLKEARLKADDANQAKSAFLANMSHEIRTPLNGIIGTASLMTDTPMNEKQAKYVNRINVLGKVLLDLINDILDFSKIEVGELKIESAPCNLHSLIKDTADLFRGKADEKGIELVVHYTPETALDVKTDPLRFRQILMNLVGNAIKFTSKGDVEINMECREMLEGFSRIRISVKDTGVGISLDKHARIFQKFSQADNSTTRKFGGTGLGLAITKQLVELLNGTIGFESEEGKGSTFWFEIPFSLDENSSTNTFFLQSIKERETLVGLKVLILDDHEINAQILKEYVEKWGMLPQIYSTPSSAFQALQEATKIGRPFDVALIDAFLPEMTGMDLALKIHSKPSLSNLPLILLSSVDLLPTEIKALGIRAYLSKPIYPRDLYNILLASLPLQMEIS